MYSMQSLESGWSEEESLRATWSGSRPKKVRFAGFRGAPRGASVRQLLEQLPGVPSVGLRAQPALGRREPPDVEHPRRRSARVRGRATIDQRSNAARIGEAQQFEVPR